MEFSPELYCPKGLNDVCRWKDWFPVSRQEHSLTCHTLTASRGLIKSLHTLKQADVHVACNTGASDRFVGLMRQAAACSGT